MEMLRIPYRRLNKSILRGYNYLILIIKIKYVFINKMDLECTICMEIKKIDDMIFLPCIHFLCSDCNDRMKKNECPFCRNKIKEEPDSYDEHENEYNDVDFEMVVMDRAEERKKRKKNKKYEKRIMRLLNNNQEVYISIDSRNTYTVLQQENLVE